LRHVVRIRAEHGDLLPREARGRNQGVQRVVEQAAVKVRQDRVDEQAPRALGIERFAAAKLNLQGMNPHGSDSRQLDPHGVVSVRAEAQVFQHWQEVAQHQLLAGQVNFDRSQLRRRAGPQIDLWLALARQPLEARDVADGLLDFRAGLVFGCEDGRVAPGECSRGAGIKRRRQGISQPILPGAQQLAQLRSQLLGAQALREFRGAGHVEVQPGLSVLFDSGVTVEQSARARAQHRRFDSPLQLRRVPILGEDH